MDVASAEQEIKSIMRLFHVLSYTPQVPQIWQRLVVMHRVLGKQTHDAHPAAIMEAHSITSILTFNVRDFERFPGVIVIDAMSV